MDQAKEGNALLNKVGFPKQIDVYGEEDTDAKAKIYGMFCYIVCYTVYSFFCY